MRATEFVGSYIDAWNHGDPQRVADHLTADGVYRDIPENAQSSHDELIAGLAEYFSTYRQQYELVGEILSSKTSIAFQYRMYPSRDQKQASPTYSGAEFMILHGDAAVTITDYYDIPGVSQRPASSPLASRVANRGKYLKSGLCIQQLSVYQQRVEEIMRTQRAFLRPDLTLPKLAQDVECSVNHLSQVINAGFGMSFFDYLNRYRIAHAREILAKQDDEFGSILNIAFTVGFNSNSAFYTAFKKDTGQTPAQYRRAELSKRG